MGLSASIRTLRLVVSACAVLLCLILVRAQAHDPNALWKIVHGRCVPREIGHGSPAPCARVDLRPGAGYAVLKDRVGIAQYLLIPTRRLAGVESPGLLAKGAPNYWAFAWHARADLEARLHHRLARDEVALAINSAYGRSQDQLHIHVDCIRPDVRRRLGRAAARIGDRWAPLRVPLRGHHYWAMRLLGSDLGEHNPFRLLAQGMPHARRHMDRQTLVVTGATFPDAGQGFIVLTDQVDLAEADLASGEELLDHQCSVATP